MPRALDTAAGASGSGTAASPAGATEARLEFNYLMPGGGPFSARTTPMFETSMRGYDRRQVEGFVEDVLGRLEAERRRAHGAEARAAAAETRLAELAADGQHGFGDRVERLLRSAEREAADVRAAAAGEAAAIVERARNHAEARAGEMLRTVTTKQAEAAERAEQLRVSLLAHQDAIRSELAAAQAQAAEVRAAAEREAGSVVEQAEAYARDVRAAAEGAALEGQERTRDEVSKLLGAHASVRDELNRLQELIADALGTAQRDMAPDAPERPSPAAVLPLRSARTTTAG